MNKKICLLPGDGIGPEILAEGRKVLEAVGAKTGCTFTFDSAHIGGAAIDATGCPLPEETITKCKASDAVYLSAVGGPKWDTQPPENRPERGLLGTPKAPGLFANLRPALLLPELAGACLLRPEAARNGLDFIVVRELTGDIYFGEPRGLEVRNGLRTGYNTMIYNEEEIRRIARIGFETARSAPWTRATFSKPRVCGGPWLLKYTGTIPKSSSAISTSTTPPCSLSAILRSSTSF